MPVAKSVLLRYGAEQLNGLLRHGPARFGIRIKTAEDEEDLETEVMTLACHLFQRLAISDHNLREMRTCGVVKVLKSCLSSRNRELRTEAEQTMNQVLSLSDG